MRPEISYPPFLMASLLATSLASAQTASPPLNIEENPLPPRNHFGFSYRLGFNISARFKNLGGYPALSNPGVTPSGDPWNYDNGYNLDDTPGTPPGMTWYWGYTQTSQAPGDDFLYLSRSSAAADLSSRTTDDPQHGFELTYNRDLGQTGRVRWGLEGALNFMSLSIEDNHTLFGAATTQTDRFSLQGNTIPPPGPGGYLQPNAPPGIMNQAIVISDVPLPFSTTVNPVGATVAGLRKVEAEVYGLRIGPHMDVPIYKNLAFSLSGGLALAAVNSKFTFNETVSIAGLSPISHSGSGSRTALLAGAYVSGNFNYAFSKSWSAFAGAQYQYLGRFSQHVGGKEAQIDLGNSIFANFGVGYSF